jgi:hypothetical protein
MARQRAYAFSKPYEEAINQHVAVASLESIRNFRRIHGSFLISKGLGSDCRLLDSLWRQTVGRRFYREYLKGHEKVPGFEDVLQDLGIGGVVDSSCSCGFYGTAHAPREFLLRNHWCLGGSIVSKSARGR